MTLHAAFFDPDDRLRNGWRILAFFLAFMALALLTYGLLGMVLPGRPFRMPYWVPGSLVDATLMVALSLAALRLERRSCASLGLRLDGRWLREFGLGALAGLVLLGSAALLARALGGFHWEAVPALPTRALLRALLLFLGVSIFEEGMCRGYPFQRLVDGVGFRLALLLGAGFFALMHWGNPGMHGMVKVWATLNIALAAVLLALAWHRTRSLALPIGIHLTWNWLQGALGFGVSGTDAPGFVKVVLHDRPLWIHGGAFGLEASLPGCLVLLAACAGLAVMTPRRAESQEDQEAP